VLGSETQPLWVEVAAFLETNITDVREVRIDGVGHLLHLQRPNPVATAISTFLRQHPM
jgi:3-oxoadipate enol-lactonase